MIFYSNGTAEINYNINVYPVWKISPLNRNELEKVGERNLESISRWRKSKEGKNSDEKLIN